jgi:hypothetical protein
MRVMCINDNFDPKAKGTEDIPVPQFGQTCNVIEQEICEGCEGYLYYALEGFPQHIGYSAKRFMPLSDTAPEIEETIEQPQPATA